MTLGNTESIYIMAVSHKNGRNAFAFQPFSELLLQVLLFKLWMNYQRKSYSSSKTTTDFEGIFTSNFESVTFLKFLKATGVTASLFSKVLQVLNAAAVRN